MSTCTYLQRILLQPRIAALGLAMVALGACDSEEAAQGPVAACQGAKCDGTGEDAAEATCLETGGSWTDDASDAYDCLCPDLSEPEDGNCAAPTGECLDAEALVQFARDRLQEEEGIFPEDYANEPEVGTFDDLDGDGVPEIIVRPGLPFTGASQYESLFMSQGTGCAEHYAGSFVTGGLTTHPHNLETGDVLDVVAPLTNDACGGQHTLYTFDGRRYEEFWAGTFDLCECDPDALIEEARTASGEFDPGDFPAEGSWEYIGDLDGDGVLDVLVYPGMSFASGTELMSIYLSAGSSCPRTHALETSGALLTVAENKSNAGPIELESVERLNECDLVITRFMIEDGVYVPRGELIEDICDA